MFDFLDMLSFGREVECHGEEWLMLRPLQNRYSLAIRPGDDFPCQVFLIKEPEPQPKEVQPDPIKGA